MPRRVSGAGRYAKDFFNRVGELRHIKRLRFWPLPDVLAEKYEMPPAEVGGPPKCPPKWGTPTALDGSHWTGLLLGFLARWQPVCRGPTLAHVVCAISAPVF